MSRPRIRIAEPERFSPRAIEILARLGVLDLSVVPPGGLQAALQDCDVFWFRLGHQLERQVLSTARCRVIASPVTGLDRIDLEACAERGIRVLSLRGEVDFLRRVRATAELALGLALALVRRIPSAAASVRDEGAWDRDRFPGRELFEKTAGLVGVGRLGEIVAGYLRAMGMRVLGYDPRPDFPHHACERVDDLGALFAESDLISIHAKYDDSTRHLVRAEHFARLRPGAVLVNTARGGIVDEAALFDALGSGRLAGAALDVLDGEPAVADHPLVAYARAHDNLLIVPHIGGNTPESWEKTEVFLAERVVSTWESIQ
jgi:D-3-phosphoglycerate dehydrogenase